MKSIILFIELLLMIIVFESCEHNRQVIPDRIEITKIIVETIKQDTLDNTIFINQNLTNRYNYQQEFDSVMGYLPPPPRNEKGEPFVFNYYKSNKVKLLGFNLSDSLSIIDQIAKNKNITLVYDLLPINYRFKNSPLFKNNGAKLYNFLIPIFNRKMDFAIIEYDYQCTGCGKGRIVFFRKVAGKWMKVKAFNTWMN